MVKLEQSFLKLKYSEKDFSELPMGAEPMTFQNADLRLDLRLLLSF